MLSKQAHANMFTFSFAFFGKAYLGYPGSGQAIC